MVRSKLHNKFEASQLKKIGLHMLSSTTILQIYYSKKSDSIINDQLLRKTGIKENL